MYLILAGIPMQSSSLKRIAGLTLSNAPFISRKTPIESLLRQKFSKTPLLRIARLEIVDLKGRNPF